MEENYFDFKKLFEENYQQKVFLQDNLIGLTHDLTKSSYTFSTAVGIFNDRFVLKYLNNELGNHVDLVPSESVIVYGSNQSITIKSASQEIHSIAIFDIAGRQLYALNVNALETVVVNMPTAKQALIVKITLSNNQQIIRKVVL